MSMNLRSVDRMHFHAPREAGVTRRMTAEGFLLCEGVAIARTGEQQYRPNDLLDEQGKCPLQPDENGIITVYRTAAEVFRPETIASFNGKPVTMEHPDEFVTPENFKRFVCGTVNNVRRAPAPEDDLLIADLLITDAAAIHHVNLNLPELSGGYNSEYVQTALGKAIQKSIVGNHVAIVDRGRAGPRIAFKDAITQPEVKSMKFRDRLAAFLGVMQTNDAAAITAALNDEVSAPAVAPVVVASTTDAKIDKLISAFDALPGALAKALKANDDDMETDDEEKPGDDEPTKKKKKESRDKKMAKAKDLILTAEQAQKPDQGKLYTGDTLQQVKSRAEILAPGITLPVGDSIDGEVVRELMKTALTTAQTTDAGKDAVAPFLMGREVKAMITIDAVSGVFNGAAEFMRIKNTQATRDASTSKTRDFGKSPPSAAESNQINREYWAKQGVTG